MTVATNERRTSRSLGAVPLSDGRVSFRVWAPMSGVVEVVIDGERFAMTEDMDGYFAGIFEAPIGAEYGFFLDESGPFPDPCSRLQPDGVHGLSQIVDTATIGIDVASWQPATLDELVIYEIHVGTFTALGTFLAITQRLKELRTLGIRAIELMPVATFPGNRGWGYDGLFTFAPHPSYGSPKQLAALIAAAHESDLGVIIDVVYNHMGPGNEKLTACGPYVTDKIDTPWGKALDFTKPGVREWAIQNAEMWIRDYKADGLRLDATHEIHDDSKPHVLKELAERVHAINEKALVISEMQPGDLRPIENWGHDAQWGDEFHHALHVLLTGERDGYYANYGTISDLANAYGRPERQKIVVCDQNHDQVGNRAFGDRLHDDKLRLAAFCSLLSPGTPLVFMGEEYDEQHPFQFFTDHIDPTVAEATRTGRRREFASFTAFAHKEIPDPQATSTFTASKLDPSDGNEITHAYYQELLALRSTLR